MSELSQKERRQIKEARMEIVASLYKRGHSYRDIRSEVMKRLNLETYSTKTVHSDVHTLLNEWRENRLDNVDFALQLELERIDETVKELWEQWEKSKSDYTKTSSKRKGAPTDSSGALRTVQKEETETEVIRLGDTSFISEIRQQLMERRKLLGLYAPEQKELTVTEYDLSNLTEEQKEILLHIGEQALNETKK